VDAAHDPQRDPMSPFVLCAVVAAMGAMTRPGHRRKAAPSTGPNAMVAPIELEVLAQLLALVRLGLDAALSLTASLAVALDAVDSDELAAERAAVSRGDSGVEVLDAIAERGGHQVGLDALVVSARYGLPVGPALERAELDAAEQLRRRTETRIRQLPVRLLFPLVLCILPAFVLVGVAPVVVAALRV